MLVEKSKGKTKGLLIGATRGRRATGVTAQVPSLQGMQIWQPLKPLASCRAFMLSLTLLLLKINKEKGGKNYVCQMEKKRKEPQLLLFWPVLKSRMIKSRLPLLHNE